MQSTASVSPFSSQWMLTVNSDNSTICAPDGNNGMTAVRSFSSGTETHIDSLFTAKTLSVNEGSGLALRSRYATRLLSRLTLKRAGTSGGLSSLTNNPDCIAWSRILASYRCDSDGSADTKGATATATMTRIQKIDTQPTTSSQEAVKVCSSNDKSTLE